jgi:phosphate-selective porin
MTTLQQVLICGSGWDVNQEILADVTMADPDCIYAITLAKKAAVHAALVAKLEPVGAAIVLDTEGGPPILSANGISIKSAGRIDAGAGVFCKLSTK